MKMVFLPPISNMTQSWVSRLREALPDANLVTPASSEEALSELADADAAFGTLTPELLAAAPGLKWLQSPMAAPPAGFYFDELVAHEAMVTNFRGIYNDHISYHILGLMLSFTKHLHDYRDQQREKVWQPLRGKGYNEIYLPECCVLIVGIGGIGAETAKLLKAIGMRVIATDPRVTECPANVDALYPADKLLEVTPEADFVVTTIPHTPESEGLFNTGFFKAMKKSGIFINIGRGMTTRLDDLNAALRNGEIAGAGLDVFEIEPLPPEHPLWDAPNTLITPHTAVLEAAHLDERRYAIIEENVRRFMAGEELVNVVDKALWF